MKLLFAAISIAMIYVSVVTSLESNLFEVFDELVQIPWMRATLYDFYFNIIIISAWVMYKEKNSAIGALWVVSFVLLGSISTAFYVWLQLGALKQGESAAAILTRRA